LVALLAQIGRQRGYEIWIGQREQRERAGGLAPNVLLRDLVTARPTMLAKVSDLRPGPDMDLLWLKGNQVAHAFEVESTTTMTSGLQRGSNLPNNVPKTMVIPEERERDHERKMKSPLFSQHFAKDHCNLLFFDAFRQAFAKTKTRTAFESLFGKKKKVSSKSVHTGQTKISRSFASAKKVRRLNRLLLSQRFRQSINKR
jgi:hypothetical protein